ncbi:MAG: hypothetical protein GXP42_19735 [Chloroflexi bacterium]|nr:hypothetical protein [Chloroflexota bacterium]
MAPQRFRERMQALLGDEAEAFFAALAQPPRIGLRVNTLKIAVDDFRARAAFPLEPVPWCDEGFILAPDADIQPGKHPYHAAGLYYLQEPSAMAAAALLDPQPGELILDLAAAPGGKATHLAARMENEGLLVVNEVVRGRVHALIENMARVGARQALIMNASPSALAEAWRERFDKVMLDAPCSAEGMFRKSAAARREWSEATVLGCAARQINILEDAARLVRPGGLLLYATCTFAPEENEAVVARFLAQHPEFMLIEPLRAPGLDHGRPDWVEGDLAGRFPLERCVRIWPHRSAGEGHFFALMEKDGLAAAYPLPAVRRGLPKAAKKPVTAFWERVFTGSPPQKGWALYGQWVHLLPVSPGFWREIKPTRAGLRVGKLTHHRFEPHHALALAGFSSRPENSLNLPAESEEARRYLHGEPLAAAGEDGWVLVQVDGFGLGWGKRVGGVVKNHYPRGLRWQGPL